MSEQIDPTLAANILKYLGVEQQPPSFDALKTLLEAYVRRVPWESASRIVRHSQQPTPTDRARWPHIFWPDAMARGTGGTCFESNYAFFTLLRFLGYEGYLTINNMDPKIGCHTAIVIILNGQKHLVDVGLPVHALLPLDAEQQTQVYSKFHIYTATPDKAGNFAIERDNHPRPYCFTLIDRAIDEATYRAALTSDYGDGGLFLDRVIVVRVVDEVIWRFSGEGVPYQLESFPGDGVTYHFLGEDPPDAAGKVAAKFGMDANLMRDALRLFP